MECVEVSSILQPGENDMNDDMPELEDYDDVVAYLFMVYGESYKTSLYFQYSLTG